MAAPAWLQQPSTPTAMPWWLLNAHRAPSPPQPRRRCPLPPPSWHGRLPRRLCVPCRAVRTLSMPSTMFDSYGSPVLEVLTIIASQTDVRLCLVSRTLRCLQLGLSSLGDITVADAPCLERLFLLMTQPSRKNLSKIKIGNTPSLHMLGYWPPGQHELQIGNAIIKARTKVSASTIIPSVQILALQVHFELCNEVKKVPSFLKCFPNVETLHIRSVKVDNPTGNVNLKFWKEACPAVCVQHVKKLVIHGFQGKKNEHAFIKYIGERTQGLEKLVIMICPVAFSSGDLDAKMRPFTTVKWANKDFKMIHFKFPSSPPTPWSFLMAIDVSCRDPFDLASAV